MSEAPSAAILDRDYARLTCEPFPCDVDALKVALIASRPKLTGVPASDLRVYHRGASEPPDADDATFLNSPHGSLQASSELRDVVGASRRAFLLVTAALPPAGARACSSSAPTAPPPLRAFPLPSHALAGTGGGSGYAAAGGGALAGGGDDRAGACSCRSLFLRLHLP